MNRILRLIQQGTEELDLKGISSSFSNNAAKFLQLLLKYQQKIDLVGTYDIMEIIDSHIMDSLAVLRILPEIKTVCDIGSGAGFPGLILSIARESLELTLVEKNPKKAYFLEIAGKEIGLRNLKIINARAESLLLKPGFDCVISRAVFKVEKWLDMAGKTGIYAVCMAGKEIEETVFAAENFKIIKKDRFTLPLSGKQRVNYLLIRINDNNKHVGAA
jgi:16S rRNA (guanine527-N7)-methyltransferase